jgi:3-hydroxybutyrate dehydrogenase
MLARGHFKGQTSAPKEAIMPFLKDKAALVTGSTSGIGLAMARALAQEGANIVLNGFGPADEIEKVRGTLEKDFGVQVFYSGADMTKPETIAAMVHDAEARFGAIDILINNAGIQHVAPIDEFPAEKWDTIIAINLTSAFHTIRHALPGMREKGWGRIINTASAHAFVASPFKSAYVAAKHGIAGLTKTVALEVAQKGITVNAIAPGYVWTPLVEKQIPDTAKSRGLTQEQVKNDVLLSAQPTKKFVTVEQVASLAVYLCSDMAASMTGSIIPMDGGWTAQ